MKKSLGQQDYAGYRLEGAERIRACAVAVGAVIFLAVVFYRSAWALPFLAPVGWVIIRYLQAQKGEKIRRELLEQFRECILSVSASLQAGFAVENAFLESREDMRSLYGEGSAIYQELERIRRGMLVNIPLEELLMDFGIRSGNEEILQFAQLFVIAKRSGGDLMEMIRTSANLIGQKIEAKQEIQTLLSGRKMEQNIMRMMPFGILFYVGSTYPGYFDPLYHNLTGCAVMSVALAVYALAILIGEKVFEGIWRQLNGVQEKFQLPGGGGNGQKEGVLGCFARLGERIFLIWGKKRPGSAHREKVRRNLEALCPQEGKEDLLLHYYGAKIGLSLAVLALGSLLALCLGLKEAVSASGERKALLLWGLACVAAAMVFFLKDKDLQDQADKRKRTMQLGYPDFVHSLALYLAAGMTIRGVFGKLAEGNELARMACREMQAGQSESAAYEHFGKRAGAREYVRLSTLLCQNLKKGTGTLLLRLEEEAVTAAESRVQSGRRLGEEAETKLLVPMVLLLAVVMLMIMVPAFSMLGI